MAAKPTIALARFADGGSADKSAPSGGLRDTGFVNGSIIAQSFVNELLFQNYSWALYLNDGALTGNHTIAGTLGVSSALTVTSGGLVVSAGGAAITGDSTVTGNLTITGVLKHPSRRIQVPIAAPVGTSSPTATSFLTSFNTGGIFQIPGLVVGERIVGLEARIRDSVTGPTKLTIQLVSSTDLNSPTLATASSQSSGLGNFQTIASPAYTVTVASGTTYSAYVAVATGTATCTITDVEAIVDQP